MLSVWFVYLIHSSSLNLNYVGCTANLVTRLADHNKGKSRFTSQASDWQVIYFEEFESQAKAFQYERLIKRNKKFRMDFYEKSKLSKHTQAPH